MGFAMAQMALVQDDIAAGSLVCPFEFQLDRGEFTYYLIYPEGRILTPEMKLFREWLRAQCATFNDLLPLPHHK
jgi:LysR family glycine cleavage system transcriptional activator